jgi:hypothetical protein
MTTVGEGPYTYEERTDWAQLPEGWRFREVVDVVVGADDRVCVFNRGEHPVMIFEADGSFVTAWGEGAFTRPHGLTQGLDGTLYCVDDNGHCVRQYNWEGELLLTIGTPGQEAPAQSGQPFNRPTKVAVDPKTGELYIADGYGNAKVHKYSRDGEHLLSWGEYGCEAGQFNLVHSVDTDDEGRVYVADRENHRVQIFDDGGAYLGQWNNLFRPCGLLVSGDRAYVGQLPTHLEVNAAYPNVGACVTIHDLDGNQLSRLGGRHPGEGPGEYTTPHGLAVDSRGDLYVGEVSFSAWGSRLPEPRLLRCFRKLVAA